MATFQFNASQVQLGRIDADGNIVDLQPLPTFTAAMIKPRQQTPDEKAFWDAHPDGIELGTFEFSITFTISVFKLPYHRPYVWQRGVIRSYGRTLASVN